MIDLNEIKRDLFFRILDEAGRVFIHITPSMDLEIGRRGLVGDELENGITLVLNSRMKFEWGDYGIDVALVFGTTPEKCFIPISAIDAIYSPELKIQFSVEVTEDTAKDLDEDHDSSSKQEAPAPSYRKGEGKVIEVDFKRETP